MSDLPITGIASTYANELEGAQTASGDIYRHALFTAAILPRARWQTVPMGTRVAASYQGRTVVITINDKGAGDGGMARVLDLSRAAYACLLGKRPDQLNETNIGLLQLTAIRVVDRATPLGPLA